MLVTERGAPAPERHEGRLSLKTWRPSKLAHVGSAEQPDTTENGETTQRFHDWLWHQRNQWDIGRRGLGLIGSGGRIRKADADHELKKALKALAGGDV